MKLPARILTIALISAIALPLTASAAKGDRKKKDDAPPALAAMDTDKDGSVSQSEFVAATKEKLGEDAAKTKFGSLDKDQSGKLSKEELAADGKGKKKGRKKDK